MGVFGSRCVLPSAIIALSLAFRVTAAVTTLTGPVTDPATGISYRLLSNGTWAASEAAAQALGGHLATVGSAAQQNFLLSTFGSFGGVQRLLWIGLSDPSHDASGTHATNFAWADGTPVTYTNWEAGEPNGAGSEFFVAMYYPLYHSPGVWNDWTDRTTDPGGFGFYGVAQVPEPGTFGLMGIGLLMAGDRRSRGRARRQPSLSPTR